MSTAGVPQGSTEAIAAPPAAAMPGAADAPGSAPQIPPSEPPPTNPEFRTLYARTAHLQSFCILTVLTWLAACDGRIAPEERELLRKVAEAGENPGELAAVIEAAQLGRPDDLELACRFLARHLDRGGRRPPDRAGGHHGGAGRAADRRRDFVLQFLADLLGVSPRAFAKLFRQATHRPFPVAGDPSAIEWWRRREAGEQAEPAADDSGADPADREGAITAAEGPMNRTPRWRCWGWGRARPRPRRTPLTGGWPRCVTRTGSQGWAPPRCRPRRRRSNGCTRRTRSFLPRDRCRLVGRGRACTARVPQRDDATRTYRTPPRSRRSSRNERPLQAPRAGRHRIVGCDSRGARRARGGRRTSR